MGVGEGVTYPSIQNLARRWVPEQQRSRALAFIYSGHQLGTIGSYLLCPLLISHLGWESVFWIFGSLGFVWLLGWLPLVSDNPPAAGGAATPAAALAAAASNSSAAAAATAAAAPASGAHEVEAKGHDLRLQDVPWASFARSKAFWAIVAAQCTVSVGNVLAFSWLPTFYNQVYGVDVVGSSAYSVLPFVVTVAATNAAGWIADGLVNNKVLDKTSTRKLMQAIASLGPAICLVKLAADQGQGSVGSVNDAVALVTAWVSLCGFSAAGYGSNHQDISKQYSGILYGLSNGLASVAASVSIYATGQVLHYTHDWSLVFEVAAGLYAAGALAYLTWASCEEQFTAEEELQSAAAAAGGQRGKPLQPASPQGKLKAP
jgi:ACS family sodium-dependent inorganic phosphate cotransporter